MSEKLLVSAYLNVGDVWHQDAKVIGTCWGFQLVHNITEQIAMNNPNKSLPMVMLDDANEALAAKDARIAELSEMLATVLENVSEWREDCAVEAMMVLANAKSAKTRSAQPSPAPVAATHSEDGRDICAAGDLRGEFLGCSFSQYRIERGIKLSLDDGVLSILLTDDQPARQVGGDEREKFEAWAQQNGIATTRTSQGIAFANGQRRAAGDYILIEALCAYAAWQARAALAPAAVAVVLPERMVITRYSSDEYDMCTKHWNEALDSVARLNRRAIPVGLIEASRRAADILGSQGFAAWDQLAAELRALLGKEGE